MIIVGKVFNVADMSSHIIRIDIDSDRRTEIVKDAKHNSYLFRFYNGTVFTDLALTEEALLALLDATLNAVCNPGMFNGEEGSALEVIRV